MAIDTAAKRKSCLGLALVFLRPGILPSGANLAAAERLHVQALYSGIAASSPLAADEDVDLGYRAQGRPLGYEAEGRSLHYVAAGRPLGYRAD